MSRRTALAAALCALLAATGVYGARAGAAPDALTVLGPGGAWSYFSDPRAVHIDGPCACTYTGWVDSLGDLGVSALDETAHSVKSFILMPRLQVDDHASPSLLVLPDGRLSVFWSGHQGRAIYTRTMTRPDDVRSFGPVRILPVRVPGDVLFTYTNPVLVPGEHNRIYLFWRSQFTHQAFATSDDLGLTWSPARVLLDEPGQRPYVKYDGRDGSIAMAFTRSHPDESPTAVYYLSYRQGRYFRADGTSLGPLGRRPFRPDQAGVVGSTGLPGANAWVQDVALGADGRPVVVYVTAGRGQPHTYHYARYDGAQWVDTALADAGPSIDQTGSEPSYSGGIALDHNDPRVVYLARPEGLFFQVQRWVTLDGGTTFTYTVPVQELSTDNLRPVVPRGGGTTTPGALWMAGSYRHYTDYATSIVTTPAVVPPSPQATDVSIEIRPAANVRDRPTALGELTLSGDGGPVPDAEVTLFVRFRGSNRWLRGAQLRTDAGGEVTFPLPTLGRADYQLEWPGDDRWSASRSATGSYFPG